MARNSAYVRVGLTGVAEFRQLLRGLSDDLQQVIVGEAVNAAGLPVVKAARAIAPSDTGALRRSIGSVVRKPKKSANAYAVIGPMRGYYRGGKKIKKGGDFRGADQPANYAHLVEWGHVKVSPKKGKTLRKRTATTTGFVLPRPFMRQAFAVAGAPSMVQFNATVIRGVEKASRKHYKRSIRAGTHG